MVLHLLAVGLGVAGMPSSIEPVLAPADVQTRYEAWAAERGQAAGALACEPLLGPEVLLCFRVHEHKRQRWVTTTDLARWKVELRQVRAAVVEHAATRAERGRTLRVTGMDADYLVVSERDGWDAAVLFRPDALAARVGSPMLVAVPAGGIVLAWRGGRPEVDKAIAVGVRELYDQEPGQVSPKVYRWSGTRWEPFAQAVPRE